MRDASLPEWTALVRASPARFRRCLIRAATEATVNDRRAWATTKAARTLGEAHHCLDCGAVLGSRQALAAHRYRQHGTRRAVSWYVRAETHCLVCLQEFWERERLLNHLADKSARCRGVLLEVAEAIPLLEWESYEHANADQCRRRVRRGVKRHFAARPVVRLSGPHTHAAVMAGVHHRHLLRGGVSLPARLPEVAQSRAAAAAGSDDEDVFGFGFME